MVIQLLSAMMLATMAQPAAETHVVPAGYAVRAAAGAPPLEQLGDDVIRFTASPALGGKAYVIEVHRTRDGSAEGEGVWLRGHPRAGWTRTGTTKIKLTSAQYDALTTEVDGALTSTPNKTDDLVICTDGPGWVTERKRMDLVSTLSGFCDLNHPNNQIAKAMQRLFPAHEF